MTEEDYKVVEAMMKYGGSFVKSLAQCLIHADLRNFMRIKTTFSDYWEEYQALAQKKSKL